MDKLQTTFSILRVRSKLNDIDISLRSIRTELNNIAVLSCQDEVIPFRIRNDIDLGLKVAQYTLWQINKDIHNYLLHGVKND